MLISIHDNSLRRVAYMDNDAPRSLHYYNEDWRRLLKEATSTFSFTVDKTGLESEQYLNEDNYVSFKHDGVQYLFSIMRTEETEQSINIYAENLNLELLNENKNKIDVTTARSLVWYLDNDSLLVGAGLTLGINEVSNQTRKIKIDSEQTGLARLISIATNFGAEVEFKVDLNSDGTLNLMFVNFFKKYDGGNQGVGTNRQDVILYYGRNIEGITRTVDKTDVYNVITPTGKDGLNIKSLVKKEYDENGVLEYYTDNGSPNIYAPQSKARYRAQLLNDADGWLRRYYSADGTSNVNTLYTLALNEIKKHAYPAITYDVTGYFDLNVGDTVRIQDSGFTPSLTLQARVAEQSICFSDPTKNKTTFGNILALESRISQDLTGRLKELVEQATPYRFEIVSDNGLTFKNNEGNTTLTARVYKGSNVDEVSVDSFEWLIDGVKFGGTTKSQLVNASQVTGTSVVRYNAKIGDTVIGGLEVTIADVSDGANGISPTVTINPDTSLTIVDAKGTSTTPALKGNDGIAGKDGTGIKTTVITYAISTSGTIAPTTGWTSTVPSLVKGQYLWTKTVWTYTDNSSETGYSVTYISKDGNNGTDGIAGKDGVGISNTIIEYVGAVSGTSKPASGWSTTIPTVAAGSFLWTRTTLNYTDNTSEQVFSVAKMGNTGETGPQGPQGLKGDPGATGIPGQAGVDGKTSYLHIAYATNSAGTAGFDTSNATGKTYIGQYTDFTSADSTDPSKYTWSLIKGDKGDKGDQGIKGANGTDGTSGIIVSSVAPSTPQTGQLWQDTSTTPQLVKKWTGSSWVIWELYAQNLKADTLETLSATIGKLNNTYTVDYGAGVHTGTVTIENGMKIVDDSGNSRTTTDFTSQSSGQGMFAQYLPNKYDSTKYQQAWYTPFSLRFDDTVNNWHGQITSENVTPVPWIDLMLKSGYTVGDGVKPQYRRIKNLDGSYSVQFRGAISSTSGNLPTTQVLVASVSGVYRPPATAMRQGSDSTGYGCVLAMTAAGNIYLTAPRSPSYVYLDALTYIN